MVRLAVKAGMDRNLPMKVCTSCCRDGCVVKGVSSISMPPAWVNLRPQQREADEGGGGRGVGEGEREQGAWGRRQEGRGLHPPDLNIRWSSLESAFAGLSTKLVAAPAAPAPRDDDSLAMSTRYPKIW